MRRLALPIALLCLGCAGGGVTGTAGSSGDNVGDIGGIGADALERTERQVMVTLAPAPPPLWERTTRELELSYRLRTVFSWTMASIGERCIVFDLPRDRAPGELAQRLASDPRVRSAQPIQVFEALAAAPAREARGDPYAHLQRGAQLIHLQQAHRWATGKGVKVAVIDTGVDLDHPDLRGRIAKAGSFVDRGEQSFASDVHGTAVAGVIAAGANDVGIVGVAPEAELFALKACWPQTPGARTAVCNSYTLAKAIDFAILEGAQVLNFSLAGPSDLLLGRLIQAALGRGIAVVAAEAPGGGPSFPASLDGVIAVAESDLDGVVRTPAGPQRRAPPLAAPGVDVLTTAPRAAYDFFSGSSISAAHVSGLAALLLERRPALKPAEIAELLRQSARPGKAAAAGAAPGPGALVDACAAVARLVGDGAGCGK